MLDTIKLPKGKDDERNYESAGHYSHRYLLDGL